MRHASQRNEVRVGLAEPSVWARGASRPSWEGWRLGRGERMIGMGYFGGICVEEKKRKKREKRKKSEKEKKRERKSKRK